MPHPPNCRKARRFLESLGRLFKEMRRKGFTSSPDMLGVARQLVDFLESTCERSFAEVDGLDRCCQVRLPSGAYAHTRVAVPPKSVHVDGETKQRLLEVYHGNEFTGILVSVIHQQLSTTTDRAMTPKSNKKSFKRPRHLLSSPESPLPKRVQKRGFARFLPLSSSPEQSLSEKGRKGGRLLHAQSCSPNKGTPRRPKAKTNGDDRSHSGRMMSSTQALHSALQAPQTTNCPKDTSIDRSTEKPTAGGLEDVPIKARTPFQDLGARFRTQSARPKSPETPMPGEQARQSVPSNTNHSGSTSPRERRGNKNASTDADFSSYEDESYDISSDMDDDDDDDDDFSPEKDSMHVDLTPMDLDTQSDVDAQDSSSLEEDLGKLGWMVSRTPDERWGNKQAVMQWIAAGQQGVKEACQLQPGCQNRAATRLDNILRHCPGKVAKVNPDHWPTYLAELKKFCTRAMFHNMNYDQRLRKIIGIVFVPEELEAVAKEEWERLEEIVGLCSVIAEAVGPDDEEVDEARKNRWIAAKKTDIAALKKLLGAAKRVAELGL
ncbi:hypothetical protein AAL_03904 [Moelleriella libera RCEF 2490]|uniref:Uncharacterized protein n=1 Tax=Moelleriella libera RCEF 2490 TaxID=1081109 RepID=A0A168CJB4_9HYPO|nr:hypothetical protein AAL_03904 [Moelleriella libera RCEF 2490]